MEIPLLLSLHLKTEIVRNLRKMDVLEPKTLVVEAVAEQVERMSVDLGGLTCMSCKSATVAPVVCLSVRM